MANMCSPPQCCVTFHLTIYKHIPLKDYLFYQLENSVTKVKKNNFLFHNALLQIAVTLIKVKVGVLRPVQQPGSYWDRSSELPLVGLEPTEVTA